jgi:O-antigen ligase
MESSINNITSKLQHALFLLVIFFLPTQLGKHFWPDFTIISGIRIDYLSPTIYLTDILIVLLFAVWLLQALSLRTKTRNSNIETRDNVQKTKFLKSMSVYIPFVFRSFEFVSDFGFRASSLLIGRWKTTLFVALLIVGIALSARPLAGLYGLIKLFEFGFFAWITSRILINTNIFNKTIITYSFGMLVQSLLAIAQFYNQGSLGGLLYYIGERSFTSQTPGIANASLNGALLLRPYGTLPHPNVLAGYLLVGIILVMSNLKPQMSPPEADQPLAENIKKMFYVITISSAVVALVLSMSRSATAAGAIILFYNLFRIKWKMEIGKWKIILFVVLVVFVCIGSINLAFPLFSRFSTIRLTDEAVVQREELNIAALNMIHNHWLFGVGLNNFIIQLPHYVPSQINRTPLQPVHNIYLLLAAETGIIGLVIFTYFIYFSFLKLRQSNNLFYRGTLEVFVCVLLLGLSDHYLLTLQQGRLLLSFIVGLICVINKNTLGLNRGKIRRKSISNRINRNTINIFINKNN